jgi:hypothetical protein
MKITIHHISLKCVSYLWYYKRVHSYNKRKRPLANVITKFQCLCSDSLQDVTDYIQYWGWARCHGNTEEECVIERVV